MSRANWLDIFVQELSRRESTSLLRRRRVVTPVDAVHVEADGQHLTNFASNDYLGLSHHPRVIAAMADAAKRYGAGSAAAPLITGYTPAHEAAEHAIANWKGTEAAVLFSSGYQANVALVHALAEAAAGAGQEARFLLDKLCHASLVDAVRGVDGGRAFRVFSHNAMQKLAGLLARSDAESTRSAAGQSLDVIVTESIFSMDGDAADLTQIASIKSRQAHQPLLIVDEAHGSGAYGQNGAGLVAELGLSHAVDATVVTLSKAVGVIGAAVCGSRAVCDTLVNLGRPYIFSTSMPAPVATAATAAIAVMHDEPHRQQRVRGLARQVRAELQRVGFQIPPGDSPIIPIVLGEETAALDAAQKLQEQGILVLAIRPPTVPRGTSRLRVTLSSEHSDQEVERLLEALKRLKKDMQHTPSPSGRGLS